MAKLNYIGRSDNLVRYSSNSSTEELLDWLKTQSVVQLDTETTVTTSIVNRKLILIQLSDEEGKIIFVVQWSFLSEEERISILKEIVDKNKLKICHNSSFEYQILLKYFKTPMENVWDTMVMEQILYAGNDEDMRFYSLANVALRRLHVDISKTQQTEFGDDIITDEKLEYAATDVLYLGHIRKQQRAELIKEDLIQLAEGEYNENEAVLAFADIEYEGMGFDKEKWLENLHKAEPIVKEAADELNSILLQEPYYSKGKTLIVNAKLLDSEGKERKVELPAILPEDRFTINWNSSNQAKTLLQYIFPDLEKCSALEVKKYLQIKDPNAPKLTDKGKPVGVTSKQFTEYINTPSKDWFMFLKLYLLKDFTTLESGFKLNFKERLIKENYLLPKDTVVVNWNSNNAKLEIFRWFNASIENTAADTVEDNIHLPFFQAYQKYSDANSLVTKFGESFIEKCVDVDNRVRTRFNTILATGRVSSSSPNMQQIPANALPEDRQNDYRNCFIPGYKDWVVVGADYASQELAVIASLSKDPVFLDALETGKDLHSVCAELVYGEKWKNSAEDDCSYYELIDGKPHKQKCKCKEHKKLRNNVKSINFGLAYGMSAKGLSGKLRIDLKEAEGLIKDYFNAFPSIQGTLNAFGNYGIMNGYIRTPAPMRRKRYFPYWKGEETPKGLMGKITRASMNTPIQGFSADMTKIALILLRRYINENNLRDKVKLFMQVHDQIDTITHKDFSEEWGKILKSKMEEAATICLGNTLLKADEQISEVWQK